MRFKPGQKVVCIKKDGWLDEPGNTPISFHPKFNEIVTVSQYDYDGTNYIIIYEYRYDPVCGSECSFIDTNFEPLMGISELTEILETIPQKL